MITIKQRPLPFHEGCKWGYINVDGGVIYPANFDYAGYFSEGKSFARRGRECLVLDSTFRTVTALEEDVHCYSSFQEGFLSVRRSRSDKCFYIDVRGRDAFGKEFDRAFDFSNGCAAVAIDEKWGFIDRSGRWVVEPTFAAAGSFAPGSNTTCVYIRETETFGYFRLIDCDGKFVCDRKFDWLGGVSEGLVPFRKICSNDAILFGVVDEQGNEVIPPIYTECDHCYSNGYLGVEVDETSWGVIDATGKWVVRPQYTYIGGFQDGSFLAYRGGRWNLDRCLLEGKYGFVTPEGGTKIDFQFDGALPFDGGIASVNWYVDPAHVDENYDISSGYVDCHGKIIWRERPT